MKTNELKKGARVVLRNGWMATIEDNMRGNTRLAKVEGHFTELGSVYSHNIMKCRTGSGDAWEWIDIVHTPAQLKHRKMAQALGM